MDTVVIGASGLVGSVVVRRFREAGIDVTGTYHTAPTDEATVQMDKRDGEDLATFVTDLDPDLVVDTAAFHDVDACEREREKAWAVNAMGTRNAAVAASEVDAHFVYLSTDYVFPGDPESAPYTESDPVDPINYYGAVKHAGEQAAKIAPRWTILRSSVLYGTASENFLTWALGELRNGRGLDIVTDQVGSPTYAGDVAEACLRLGRRGITGLFHATGPESISRYEFTKRFVKAFGRDPSVVNPVSTEEIGQRANRPADSSLDSSALYDRIGYTFRDTETALGDLALEREVA